MKDQWDFTGVWLKYHWSASPNSCELMITTPCYYLRESVWLSSYKLNHARMKVSSGPKCHVNTLLVQIYDAYLKPHLGGG